MKEQLPRGIRNNNPGNIRHGANWLGLNPNGRNIDSAFCVFESPVLGIRALAKVLINYKKIHGLNTVRQIVSRYAPPNENQTAAYIQTVAKQLEVYPDTKIDIEKRGVLTVFIKAVIRMENGIQPYSDETIQKGIDLCLD
nr:MAG TPA: virion protein [Caudoviricetes sp.]